MLYFYQWQQQQHKWWPKKSKKHASLSITILTRKTNWKWKLVKLFLSPTRISSMDGCKVNWTGNPDYSPTISWNYFRRKRSLFQLGNQRVTRLTKHVVQLDGKPKRLRRNHLNQSSMKNQKARYPVYQIFFLIVFWLFTDILWGPSLLNTYNWTWKILAVKTTIVL